MKMISEGSYEDAQERFRLAVLKAMDEAMNRECAQLGVSPRDNCTGARDADLPALFPALDAQFSRNCAHVGIVREAEDEQESDEDKAFWSHVSKTAPGV